MKKIIFLFCFASLLMSFTCDDNHQDRDQIFCTEELRAGLNVTVTLDGAIDHTAEGISVTARDGSYIEDLVQNDPETSVFLGAYERTGNYTITVSKEGYETYTSDVIAVGRDRCHVIGRQLSVNLIPEE